MRRLQLKTVLFLFFELKGHSDSWTQALCWFSVQYFVSVASCDTAAAAAATNSFSTLTVHIRLNNSVFVRCSQAHIVPLIYWQHYQKDPRWVTLNCLRIKSLLCTQKHKSRSECSWEKEDQCTHTTKQEMTGGNADSNTENGSKWGNQNIHGALKPPAVHRTPAHLLKHCLMLIYLMNMELFSWVNNWSGTNEKASVTPDDTNPWTHGWWVTRPHVSGFSALTWKQAAGKG